jgi:hypothetical protein
MCFFHCLRGHITCPGSENPLSALKAVQGQCSCLLQPLCLHLAVTKCHFFCGKQPTALARRGSRGIRRCFALPSVGEMQTRICAEIDAFSNFFALHCEHAINPRARMMENVLWFCGECMKPAINDRWGVGRTVSMPDALLFVRCTSVIAFLYICKFMTGLHPHVI